MSAFPPAAEYRPIVDQPSPGTDHPPTARPVGGRVADWLGGVFYVVVAATALAGQTGAAVGWLGWPVVFALPAVAALELGGIALAARADFRRRLGERAVAARVLSAGVAVFAVAFNWAGHADHLAGGFFAGMSALGYGVWLIQAGDRRRDQLRAAGQLPAVPPAYPLGCWLRRPWVTRRARELARARPQLGLYGSLQAAAEAVRTERRQAAIARVLRRKVTAGMDRSTARIAVTVYDLDEIARRLAARADYEGLTALIATDLDLGRLLGNRPTDQSTTDPTGQPTGQPADPDAPVEDDRPEPTGARVPRPGPAAGSAAVANAARLRELYGDRLPTVQRQIRARTGWSAERVERAVAAYRAGADLQPALPDRVNGASVPALALEVAR